MTCSSASRPLRRCSSASTTTLALALLLTLSACQKKVPETNSTRPAPSAVKPTIAPARPAPTPAIEKPRPGPLAEWVQARNYRLRVVDATPCDDPSEDAARTQEGPSGTSNGFRLGVTIEVEATEYSSTTAVVVSPAAATVEKGGKVFRALRKPDPTPACDDLLGLEKLAPREVTRGQLVFSAPNESYLRSALFAFKPPRWGGEKRLEVQLPDCFGKDCS